MQKNDTQVLRILLDQVRETRGAYYRNVPGVTYEDMANAAHRYLTMRNLLRTEPGRKPRAVTKNDVAGMLRGL